jgi:hypothetical protein
LVIAIVIISIIISLLLFLYKNKPAEEEIDWSSLNQNQQSEKLVVEIPESEVDVLFEGQSEDEELLQQLSSDELELPEGWTIGEYSEWLKGPLPDGWEEEQWRLFSGEKLAIIESQDIS